MGCCGLSIAEGRCITKMGIERHIVERELKGSEKGVKGELKGSSCAAALCKRASSIKGS